MEWQQAQLEDMRSAGFATLDDITRLSFEEFWQQPEFRDWRSELMALMVAHNACFTDADPVKLLAEDLKEEGLSTRTRYCLIRRGIFSLAMLRCLSAPTLMELDNFGTGCLDDVRAMLRVHNMALKGETVQ